MIGLAFHNLPLILKPNGNLVFLRGKGFLYKMQFICNDLTINTIVAMFTIQHSDSPRAARLGSPRAAHLDSPQTALLGSPLAAHSGPRLRLVRRHQPTRTTRLHQSPLAAPQALLLGHNRGALSLGGRQRVFLANLRLRFSALPPLLPLALPPLLLLEPLLQVRLLVHLPLNSLFFFSQ